MRAAHEVGEERVDIEDGVAEGRRSLIDGSRAPQAGGGLAVTGNGTTVMLEDSTVRDNTAVTDGGGGIAAADPLSYAAG